jgi:hypothetical protein
VYTLTQLEQAIRQSWGPDTVEPSELMASDVLLDGRRVMAHMWNRLPSGIEVDLTREQFRDGEILENCRASVRLPASVLGDPAHPRYHRYLAYQVLADRVGTRLRLHPT